MSTLHSSTVQESFERMALLFTLYSKSSQMSFSLIMKLLAASIEICILCKDCEIQEIAEIKNCENEQISYISLYKKESFENKKIDSLKKGSLLQSSLFSYAH
jgi:type IV secretory pathway ATPase VirB11/archaellum biosynthesis ATPase